MLFVGCIMVTLYSFFHASSTLLRTAFNQRSLSAFVVWGCAIDADDYCVTDTLLSLKAASASTAFGFDGTASFPASEDADGVDMVGVSLKEAMDAGH